LRLDKAGRPFCGDPDEDVRRLEPAVAIAGREALREQCAAVASSIA